MQSTRKTGLKKGNNCRPMLYFRKKLIRWIRKHLIWFPSYSSPRKKKKRISSKSKIFKKNSKKLWLSSKKNETLRLLYRLITWTFQGSHFQKKVRKASPVKRVKKATRAMQAKRKASFKLIWIKPPTTQI